MTKQKGLGRGLDALLDGGGDFDKNEGVLQNLKISYLHPGKYQPRTSMDKASLAELADSIKAHGVMQPILVRQTTGNIYEIIAGERRWRAAQLAGLREVPVLIREVADEDALGMALIENIQRENLNPLEEALGVQRLIKEFGMTHQAVGHVLGSSRSSISNLLRLLSLPMSVQKLMMRGKLDMGHGRALLALHGVKQIEAANLVVHRNLSVRETEILVGRMSGAKSLKKHKSRDLLLLQEEVSSKLGAQIAIKPGKKERGNLIIHYSNLEQLDEILAKLRN
ncbi:MAG: chromosome partitioning protein ParB [Nitrosomonadaceae bacterium]|nr:chromosome partitioning protein ParB [Nitrosomonadaceae bacterium]|tara:strand:- start:358 stop:1200 length:843 start_codon:yes stop_codon:yes gene_type:complete